MRLDVFEVFRGKIVSPANPTYFYSQESRNLALGMVDTISFHFVIDQVVGSDIDTDVYLEESGDGQSWSAGIPLGGLSPLSADSTHSFVLTSGETTAARVRLAIKVNSVASYNMKVTACVRGTWRTDDGAQVCDCGT